MCPFYSFKDVKILLLLPSNITVRRAKDIVVFKCSQRVWYVTHTVLCKAFGSNLITDIQYGVYCSSRYPVVPGCVGNTECLDFVIVP